MRMIFSGLSIVLENELVTDHAVIIDQTRIQAIIPDNMISHHLPANHYHFPASFCLTPGFIDLHIHGANGFDVMDGTTDAIAGIATAIAQEGVTGFLATTLTATDHEITATLAAIANYHSEDGACLLGVHLEGPFISPHKAGAQLANAIRDPDIHLFNAWQTTANHLIKMVTLAPEQPQAMDFIKALRQQNVIASIGHTQATYTEAQTAIQAGCTHATHLFNAMSALHHRDPGAAGAILFSPKVSAEIIADGIHVHPMMLALAYQLKSEHQLVLVTDAMRAKCMKDGTYDLGGQAVNVKESKATLQDGTLAGSVLRMPEAIQLMKRASNCSLPQAVQMASLNPARILGIEQEKGSISIGKHADLVVLDDAFQPLLTLREGHIIYSSEQAPQFINH